MSMPLKTISFRLPEEKLQELDTVAAVQQRDRSFVINEAVTQYLSFTNITSVDRRRHSPS
jgi:predicted transcriptional regulator